MDFCLSNKLCINPGKAGPDPPLIPVSGSACIALSDIDANPKSATTEKTQSGA